VLRPLGTELLSIEGEVAAIIRTAARNVTPDRALEHVGWFAPANDIGLYDLRWADRGSNLFSKGQDGFTPVGPATDVREVDPRALVLRTRINGETVQEDSTANLIFPISFLIADLSRFITLEPGDIVLTGTPAGSRVAQPDDVVEVEVEGVGTLRNTIGATTALAAFGAQPKITPEIRAEAHGLAAPRPVVLSDAAKFALSLVSTATLTVQLSKRGIRNSFIQGLRSTRPDLRLLGYAYTLRYVPLREDVRDANQAELNAQKRAIESIGPDEVLVIDAREDPGAGTIGDILAARALARGATGIVTDGGLRDTAAMAGLEIPTYFKAPHAAVLGLIHYPLETNVPVGCGGALVIPGDVIVGDADGLVVLPAALAEEVAHDAVEQEEREAWALERVREGESVRGIYPLSEERRPEFEAWRAARVCGGGPAAADGSPTGENGRPRSAQPVPKARGGEDR
jgi:5-oxopent-3-ene-1,2,5-tricarboxylate decarboxylase / 2-hydroxyhepta-2,4-diene-1,7-dioate isomerase